MVSGGSLYYQKAFDLEFSPDSEVIPSMDKICQMDFTLEGSFHFQAEIGSFGEQQSPLMLSHRGNVTCHTYLLSASSVSISAV